MIRECPGEVDDRAVPGHWEGDLILGLGSSAVGTLVERTTRFTMLLHLPRMPSHGEGYRAKNGPALAGHGAEAVRDAITRTITTLPEALRRSLTWDQGAEMTEYPRLRINTGLQVYFCDPHTAHDSVARTRARTGCCGSTFRRGRTWPRTAPTTLRPWPPPSTRGRARPSAGEHLPKLLMRCCDQRRQALRRPVEAKLDAAIRCTAPSASPMRASSSRSAASATATTTPWPR